MPFHFSLRALLRVRQVEERRERLRLTLLNASRARLRNDYDEIGRHRLEEFKEFERRLGKGVSGAELRFDQASLQISAKRRRELAALMEALELQRQKQIATFAESQKKRKALDLLREREWRAFQQIEDRREQQRTDDLFARRQRPG